MSRKESVEMHDEYYGHGHMMVMMLTIEVDVSWRHMPKDPFGRRVPRGRDHQRVAGRAVSTAPRGRRQHHPRRWH
jgi:hypothetical protein